MPAGSLGSIVVCISPLTSLMMDQQAKFTALGLKAEFVGEAQSDNAVRTRVLNGDVQIVLITPESLINNDTHQHATVHPLPREACCTGSR